MNTKARMRQAITRRNTWLFDYDGVIVPDFTMQDVKRAFRNAHNLVLEMKGANAAKAENLTQKIGMPLLKELRRIFPEASMHDLFRRTFVGYKNDTGHFGKDEELIAHLEKLQRTGVLSAVLSVTPAAVVSESMEKKRISGFFKDVMGCDSLGGTRSRKEKHLFSLLNASEPGPRKQYSLTIQGQTYKQQKRWACLLCL